MGVIKGGAKIFFFILLTIVWVALFSALQEALYVSEKTFIFIAGDGGETVLFLYSILLSILIYTFIHNWRRYKNEIKAANKKRTSEKNRVYIEKRELAWKKERARLLKVSFITSIAFLPLVFLALDHYIAVEEDQVRTSHYWEVGKRLYAWEAIDSAEVEGEYDEGTYFGYYGLNFKDGTYWDIWDGGSVNASSLLPVDNFIKQNGYEKEIYTQPAEYELESFAEDNNATADEVRSLFSF